jgi:hypothetical protein
MTNESKLTPLENEFGKWLQSEVFTGKAEKLTFDEWKEKRAVKAGDSITIIGRRWFDRINGNTYFSAVGIVNGIEVVHIPYEYGYGNHYEDRIFQELEKAGYCPDVEHYNNGGSERLWQYCNRKGLIKYVTHSDVTRKKDL